MQLMNIFIEEFLLNFKIQIQMELLSNARPHEEKKYLEFLGEMLDLVNGQINHPLQTFKSSDFHQLFIKKHLVLQHFVDTKISLMLKRHCR